MKKILKISLAVFTVLALAIGGYLLYILKFKQYDVADEEVDEIIEAPYTIELPEDDVGIDDDAANDVGGETTATENKQPTSGESSTAGDQTQSANQPAATAKPSSQTNHNLSAGSPQPAKKTTVAAIKQKYTPTFANLESQADAKLNALIGRAKGEYDAKKANGEKVDYGYFYNKYSGAASALEANTDAAFNTVLSAVEKDLAKHGYDKSYAQSFKEEYESMKKARQDGILSKVTGL